MTKPDANMTESSLVSVIVPVYNVEAYLRQCLDSIIDQTYTNLEVILVNDGSTDSSGRICQEYANKDNRILSCDKENGGASSARNHGIAKARGEYVYFADSDDYLELNAIQTLVSIGEKHHTDCIYFDAHNFAESSFPAVKTNSLRLHAAYPVLNGKALIPKLIKNKDYHAAPFQYFIRKHILDHIRFEEGIMFEDELFSFQILLKSQIVLCYPCVLYHRRVHEGSVMTSKERGIYRFHSISRILERLFDIYAQDSNSTVKMYLVRIAILWLTRYDELSQDEKIKIETEYRKLRILIKKEKYFGSVPLFARCLGYAPWFISTIPEKIGRHIRLWGACGQRSEF